MYEYVFENGIWKLYWGGKLLHTNAAPSAPGDEPARPLVARREQPQRTEEPVLVLQA